MFMQINEGDLLGLKRVYAKCEVTDMESEHDSPLKKTAEKSCSLAINVPGSLLTFLLITNKAGEWSLGMRLEDVRNYVSNIFHLSTVCTSIVVYPQYTHSARLYPTPYISTPCNPSIISLAPSQL